MADHKECGSVCHLMYGCACNFDQSKSMYMVTQCICTCRPNFNIIIQQCKSYRMAIAKECMAPWNEVSIAKYIKLH